VSCPAPKNLEASILRRLLNQAQESGRPFNELLQYFAIERFLYRLSYIEQYAGMRLHPVVPDLNQSPLSQLYRG
jgi:hypothetical protein